MIKNVFFVLVILYFKFINATHPRFFPKIEFDNDRIERSASEALFLTPLIEEGKIQEAQNASKTDFNDMISYSGFLTVSKNYNSNLFFWFFPSRNDFENDPVLLWLQGGPGGSSMFGLFLENGPYFVRNEQLLEIRQYSWNKNHSVIYIDNPVGAGFSFTDNDNGFAKTQEDIAYNLYNALLQFFQLFPKLQNNSFFITGESYAGKYIPAIAYKIHKSNPTANQKINLEGLAIGNGVFNREHQMNYGQYFYQIGIIDIDQRKKGEEFENRVIDLVKKGNFQVAHDVFNEQWDYYVNASGFNFIYNYLHSERTFKTSTVSAFLRRSNMRDAMHVGNRLFFDHSIKIYTNLYVDSMQSVEPWLSEILSHYRVLLYNGQLDLTLPYPLMVNFLQNLLFSGANEYKIAPRQKWYVDGDLAGYVKLAGNLTEVLVRNAGHLVPMDQPKWAMDLITKFVRKEVIGL